MYVVFLLYSESRFGVDKAEIRCGSIYGDRHVELKFVYRESAVLYDVILKDLAPLRIQRVLCCYYIACPVDHGIFRFYGCLSEEKFCSSVESADRGLPVSRIKQCSPVNS